MTGINTKSAAPIANTWVWLDQPPVSQRTTSCVFASLSRWPTMALWSISVVEVRAGASADLYHRANAWLGSASQTATRKRLAAKLTAKAVTVVVFEQPPLLLATTMTD